MRRCFQMVALLTMAAVVAAVGGCDGGKAASSSKSSKKTTSSKSGKKSGASGEPPAAPPPRPKVIVSPDAYADAAQALRSYEKALIEQKADEVAKVEAWLELCADRAVPVLGELLRRGDGSLESQIAAGRALGRCGSAAAPVLIQVIAQTSSNPVRYKAIESLSILKPSSPANIQALQNLLKNKDVKTRQFAVQGLARIGPPAKQVVEDLKSLLNSQTENETVRGAAKDALKKIDPRRGFHGMDLD